MKPAWIQIAVALALGAALGALFTLRCSPLGFHGGWGNPEKIQRQMMERFTSKLQLTSDQREKVSAILEDTRSKINALRQETRPRFQEIRNAARAQIRELLTLDQQKKFDAMNAERDARFEKRHVMRRGSPVV